MNRLLIAIGIVLLFTGAVYPLVTISTGEWVSPTGYEGNAWTEKENAYDGDVRSSAYAEVAPGGALNPTWSDFLILTLPNVVVSDKLRFYCNYGTYGSNWIDVDVYKDNAWADVYEGFYAGGQWTEKTFSQDSVSKVRLRHQNTLSDSIGVYINEVNVWQVPTTEQPPSSQSSETLRKFWSLMLIGAGVTFILAGIGVKISKRK